MKRNKSILHRKSGLGGIERYLEARTVFTIKIWGQEQIKWRGTNKPEESGFTKNMHITLVEQADHQESKSPKTHIRFSRPLDTNDHTHLYPLNQAPISNPQTLYDPIPCLSCLFFQLSSLIASVDFLDCLFVFMCRLVLQWKKNFKPCGIYEFPHNSASKS